MPSTADARRIRLAAMTALVLTAASALTAGSAQARPVFEPQCGAPIESPSTNQVIVRFKANVTCPPGDGLVVGRDNVRIEFRGFSLTGSGSGVGIRVNAHRHVTIEGHDPNYEGSESEFTTLGPAGVGIRSGSIRGFATGVMLDGADGNIHDMAIGQTTGDAIRFTGSGLVHHVALAYAGGNGIRILNGAVGFLWSDRVVGNAVDGITTESTARVGFANVVTKQNGDDGLDIHDPVEDEGAKPRVFVDRIRANYNGDWGVESVVLDLPRRGDPDLKAIGNGQTRQCLNVSCNAD